MTSAEQVIVEFRPLIQGLVGRLVPAADVDDVTQEVCLKLSRALPQFRAKSTARTWVYRVARNAALDRLRGRAHRQRSRTDALPEENAPLPEAAVERRDAAGHLQREEMNDCIRQYLTRLAPDYREVLELKDLAGLTNLQIAERLGVSLETAKVRVHRARAALRRELEARCDFYQGDSGNLACDRRQRKGVSLDGPTSSKEARLTSRARRAAQSRISSESKNVMSSPSTCGCAAPETCAPSATSTFSAIAAEYVALGAAVGSNCEGCLKYHVQEALRVGISLEDIARAVAQAEKVKATPARAISQLAERLTRSPQPATASSSGGCGCSA